MKDAQHPEEAGKASDPDDESFAVMVQQLYTKSEIDVSGLIPCKIDCRDPAGFMKISNNGLIVNDSRSSRDIQLEFIPLHLHRFIQHFSTPFGGGGNSTPRAYGRLYFLVVGGNRPSIPCGRLAYADLRSSPQKFGGTGSLDSFELQCMLLERGRHFATATWNFHFKQVKSKSFSWWQTNWNFRDLNKADLEWLRLMAPCFSDGSFESFVSCLDPGATSLSQMQLVPLPSTTATAPSLFSLKLEGGSALAKNTTVDVRHNDMPPSSSTLHYNNQQEDF